MITKHNNKMEKAVGKTPNSNNTNQHKPLPKKKTKNPCQTPFKPPQIPVK